MERLFNIAARDLIMAISIFCLGELFSFKQEENKVNVIV
jgi:hypothetical protein